MQIVSSRENLHLNVKAYFLGKINKIFSSAEDCLWIAVPLSSFGLFLFQARVSGGCMNPARNFGPALITGNFDKQWVSLNST